MRIRWTPEAAADLDSIDRHLRDSMPHYRHATMRKMYTRIQELKANPNSGRIGRIEGTRELLCLPLPYVIVYSVHEGTAEILRIFHAAREWA